MPLEIHTQVPLKNYTTYKTGGPAEFLVCPQNASEVADALKLAADKQLPWYLLGKGSNLVVSDQGYKGVMIYLGEHLRKVEVNGEFIRAEAGALLHTVVGISVQNGLQGMENLGGIPGTMGGAIYINAGAFDQEIKDVAWQIESLDTGGKLHVREASECGFTYRHSNYFQWNEIITNITLKLKAASAETLKDQMQEILKRRKSKQPLEYPNAGSMYKRPPGTYAGKLIEEAGLKGFSVGGAQISPKHSNFVINYNQATSQDIFDLSEEVIRRVRENCGITLEKEQIFIGDFQPWPR